MLISVLVLLLQSTTAAPNVAPTGASAATTADSKLVCRRFAETGSFVRKTKVCRTRADWRRIEEQAREDGRALQTRISTEQGG